MAIENKENYQALYRLSFRRSTKFLIDWARYFRDEPKDASVMVCKAQLRLRGIDANRY